MSKRQIHPTGVETFAACGEAYRRRYIEGERTPPAAAMVVGTAVDRSVRENLSHKIETGELLEAEAVEQMARDTLECEWGRGEVLLDEGESKDGAVDKAVGLAGLHRSALAPVIQPVSVARKCVIEVPGYDFQLAGEIDIQEANAIRDTKTKKTSPQADMAHDSLQLTAYFAFVRVVDGKGPAKVALDVLWQTPKRKESHFRVLESTRTVEDEIAFLERVAVMDMAIKAGVFHPARQDDWRCSAKWCGYFGTCKYARKPQTVTVT